MSENSEADSSSESSSSDSEIEIDDVFNKDFFKTLSCLKKKDPRIYDSKVTFFQTEDIEKGEDDVLPYENPAGTDEDEVKSKSSPRVDLKKKTSYFQQALNDDSSDDDDIKFQVREVSHEEVHNEPDHIEFLKGKKQELRDKETEKELKPLFDLWNRDDLDPNEKYLKDYILNKKFLDQDTSDTNKVGDVNLSDDEKELEEQEVFEENYNRRFETDDNMTIKRYPRTVEGSLRRKNDVRKKKRAEIAQRKKEEKKEKHKELKKEQKKKLHEIEDKLKELKELTGNPQLGFKDSEILEDFDPDKHDQRMQELFNDDFYAQDGDGERPVFEDAEDNDNFIMDCDADLNEIREKKLTRSQRKKNRKKKAFQDVIDITKPSFDPNVHSDFKKYLDEYYSIDCEDFIDDIPCRYKYREVVPNDFGLSVEEILMADDKELNQWASLKKIQKLRPEHVERNEVNVYRIKANNEAVKKKILKSLYDNPEEEEDFNSENILKSGKGVFLREGNFQMRNKMKMQENMINDTSSAGTSKPNELSETDLLESNEILLEKKSENVHKKKRKNRSKESKINTHDEKIINKNTYGEEEPSKQKMKRTISDLKNENESPMKNENGEAQGPSKKKRRKKKNKKRCLNSDGVETVSRVNAQPAVNSTMKNSQQQGKKKFKNKMPTPKNSVVSLSDSRLLAYGIKPKKFRSKIIYGQSN